MSDQSSIVTTCTFKGKDYLVKMNIVNGNTLELFVTDKYSAEDWQCCYNASYIESLTQKTGNYKQFEVFVTMLKSGLLKTSECVSLDLLTHEDLEILRTRRGVNRSMYGSSNVQGSHVMSNSNRRFFIITYNVEFDRIHYPLPMEYCGPPDPQVLQATVRRLEAEVSRLQNQLVERSSVGSNERIAPLERRIEELTVENRLLKEEIRHLNKTKIDQEQLIHRLDNKVQRKTIRTNKLTDDITELQVQVKQLRASEKKLKLKLQNLRKYEKIYKSLRIDHDDECVVDCVNMHLNTNEEDRIKSPKGKRSCDAKYSLKTQRVQTIKSIPQTTPVSSEPISCFLHTDLGKNIYHRSSSQSSVGSSILQYAENEESKTLRQNKSDGLRTESRRSRTRNSGSRTRKMGSPSSSRRNSPVHSTVSSRHQSTSRDFNRNKHESRIQKEV